MFSRIGPLALSLLLGTTLGMVAAEDPPATPGEDEKKLGEVVGKMAAALKEMPGYAVTVKRAWKTVGGAKDGSTGDRCTLAVGPDGKFRLEEFPEGKEGAARLVIVSDGKNLVRMVPEKKLYSEETDVNPHEAVYHCALTLTTFDGTGLDLLLREVNLPAYVVARATNVTDLGEADLDGKKARHFRLMWGPQKVVEVWFDDKNLPRKFTTTLNTSLAEGKTFSLITTADLTWASSTEIPAESFALKIPEGLQRVNDLMNALAGDEAVLLGKPAPELKLTTLDGKPFTLAPHEGKDVAVLFFWATWCAPSLEVSAKLTELVREYQAKGVVFFAVNVGEKPDVVRDFATKAKVRSTVVLDPESKAATTYGLTKIPAAVLIGKDGTVQAILHDTGDANRTKLREALDALRAGKPLVGR